MAGLITLRKKSMNFLRRVLGLSVVDVLTGNKKCKSQDKSNEALLCMGESCFNGEAAWKRTQTDLEINR